MFSTGPTPQGRQLLLHRMTSFFKKKKKKQPYCDDVGEDEVCYGSLYLHSKSMHAMICIQQVREPCSDVTVSSAELAEVSTTIREL